MCLTQWIWLRTGHVPSRTRRYAQQRRPTRARGIPRASYRMGCLTATTRTGTIARVYWEGTQTGRGVPAIAGDQGKVCFRRKQQQRRKKNRKRKKEEEERRGRKSQTRQCNDIPRSDRIIQSALYGYFTSALLPERNFVAAFPGKAGEIGIVSVFTC